MHKSRKSARKKGRHTESKKEGQNEREILKTDRTNERKKRLYKARKKDRQTQQESEKREITKVSVQR